jgi:hypothetical protein
MGQHVIDERRKLSPVDKLVKRIEVPSPHFSVYKKAELRETLVTQNSAPTGRQGDE